MFEIGAGAGRNTLRYKNFERIVVMDYSTTQLEQAQKRLGASDKYIYIAADVYKLPFKPAVFDAATMIRVIHHMSDAPAALKEITTTLQPGATFILEFANKLNLKAIARYLLRQQDWSPFTPEPVEFVELNFDFHPKTIRQWMKELGYEIKRQLTVSHFRIGILKRLIPASLLAFFDSLASLTGGLWQLSPSVFVKAVLPGSPPADAPDDIFCCPISKQALHAEGDLLVSEDGKYKWGKKNGIYNFKDPVK
jgi:SAM-dependent methyltransferase